MTGIEKDLIESIKKANAKSFELIFKTYYKRLCTFAYDYTRQKETAEDIVKDFFVGLWNNRQNISISTSLSGYLFRSVRNACINYIQRDMGRNRILSLEELSRLNIKIKEPFSENYPSGNILAKELENKIFTEIDKLPPNCREIFMLSRFEGLSHKNIAEKLNFSENTVKVQIYNALKRLREAIVITNFILFYIISKKN